MTPDTCQGFLVTPLPMPGGGGTGLSSESCLARFSAHSQSPPAPGGICPSRQAETPASAHPEPPGLARSRRQASVTTHVCPESSHTYLLKSQSLEMLLPAGRATRIQLDVQHRSRGHLERRVA